MEINTLDIEKIVKQVMQSVEAAEKDHTEENCYHKESEIAAYADNKEKAVTDIHSCGCSVSRVSWLSDKWCVDGRDCF